MDKSPPIVEFGFKLCKSLKSEGATYSSIILADEKSVLYKYSSSQSWDNLYHETGYSKSCHLIQATKKLAVNNKNFTLFWDYVAPENEISLYLNAKRKENNICHGVSFCTINKNGILEILTLTGKNSDINFASKVISSKQKIQTYLMKSIK
jgi:hypothetical protein